MQPTCRQKQRRAVDAWPLDLKSYRMFIAILFSIMIPLLVVVSAYWAHKRRSGKIHLVWGNASTMGDPSLKEEVEDDRIIKLKLNELRPSSKG